MQERLLRVVEYGSFDRVGGSAPVQVDVRLIGATNVDLPAAAAAGSFRHDLLDRLAFDVLTVPPLRARTDDIPLLAESFGRAMALELGWETLSGLRPQPRSRRSKPTPGPATCASSRTSSSARSIAPPRRGGRSRSWCSIRSPRPSGRGGGRSGRACLTAAGRQRTTSAPRSAPSSATCSSDALAACRHNQRATAARLGLSYDQLRNQLRKHDLLGGRR